MFLLYLEDFYKDLIIGKWEEDDQQPYFQQNSKVEEPRYDCRCLMQNDLCEETIQENKATICFPYPFYDQTTNYMAYFFGQQHTLVLTYLSFFCLNFPCGACPF